MDNMDNNLPPQLPVQVALPPLPSDLDKLLEEFLSSQDIKPISKSTYLRRLRQFFLWLIDNQLQSPTRDDVLNFKLHLSACGVTGATLSNYITAVRRFFTYLESVKLYPNIAKDIKGAKQPRGFRRDPLTVDQVKELLQSIDRSDIDGKRDFAVINLLVRTGIRTIELVRANVGDMSQNGSEGILRIQGKGQDEKQDYAVLTKETLRPLLDYLSYRRNAKESEPLFTSFSFRNNNERLTTRSVSRIVKERLRAIGIDSSRLTAHSLRHSAITFCLMAGGTIQEAQVLARHTNLNTTLIYSHNIDRLKDPPERKIDNLLSEDKADKDKNNENNDLEVKNKGF